MEVPRLRVQLELQLLAYATAMPDPSLVCDLHHSSRQHQILNPLSEARNHDNLSHNGNSSSAFYHKLKRHVLTGN